MVKWQFAGSVVLKLLHDYVSRASLITLCLFLLAALGIRTLILLYMERHPTPDRGEEDIPETDTQGNWARAEIKGNPIQCIEDLE